MPDHPPSCFCCENQIQPMTWSVFLNHIRDHMSDLLHKRAFSTLASGSDLPRSSECSSSTGSYSSSSSTPNSQSTNQTVSTTATLGSSNCLPQIQKQESSAATDCIAMVPSWILFGVQGSRWCLELEHIKISNFINDPMFFRELRLRYKRHRSWIKMILSPFRFRFCRFVKVSPQ